MAWISITQLMISNKKIFVVAKDQGSIQTILPVITKLQIENYEFDIFIPKSKRNFVEKYLKRSNNVILKFLEKNNLNLFDKFLKSKSYDLILTGSSPSFKKDELTPEQNIIFLANEYSIPSITILDYWGLYLERFSRDGLSIDKKLLPKILCTLDKNSKKALIALGIPNERIKITHNPWMDAVVEYRNKKFKYLKDNQENLVRINFISQPLRRLESNNNICFEHLKIICQILSEDKRKNYLITIFKHPSEENNKWDGINSLCFRNIKINSKFFYKLSELQNSKLLISYNSTLMYEALYLGIPCISLGLGVIKEKNYIDKLKLSKRIEEIDQLKIFLRDFEFDKESQRLNTLSSKLRKESIFFSDGNATKKIIENIDELLLE